MIIMLAIMVTFCIPGKSREIPSDKKSYGQPDQDGNRQRP